MGERPQNVGILAMEVYFPVTCVRQDKLEEFDGASKGKYTIGLGQDSLAFCTDWEDVVSMSLTVVQSLLEKYDISPERIGRLEVGSETVIDKSKSIKTWIMKLFEECGNSDIEGVDSTNACYGGTAAVLNCVDWVESSAWDGRFALVIAADSAVYAEGPARPTGGAGAVAMLIGPDAPLVLERRYTASHMAHTYDFYKPNLASEYPVVDGKLTQTCFLKALDMCYRKFCTKFQKRSGKPFSLKDVDYFVCHSPYNKLVQKSFARLLYNDYLKDTTSYMSELDAAKFQPFANLSLEESYTNRDLEKVSQQAAKSQYEAKVSPATLIPKQVGNMYCASLYAGLGSLVHSTSDRLAGKRVILFSYGSGLASTLFSIHVRESSTVFSLSNIAKVMDIEGKLASRVEVSPKEFQSTMHLMEKRYGAKDFTPESELNTLRPGTFYLTKVDPLYRRFYARTPLASSKVGLKEANANGYLH
ncbi:hypothetical protein O6H91_12G104800 [Diphasiastrum complanatum]|uniref:Uncharacterized protein n=1 Tax=Diphasiastrum complanatum TaxID=34168 RepID=A0ACC2C6I0_DIPCM|nr:hypothetical protein O6H91_12G104800 [Diphasiastrum complanatum]